MQITNNMINEVNEYLESNKAIFRFQLFTSNNNNFVKIVPIRTVFINMEDINISINNKLIEYLDNYFMQYSINLVFNNHYNVFWSANKAGEI